MVFYKMSTERISFLSHFNQLSFFFLEHVDVQGSSAPQLLHEDVNGVAVLEVVVTDLVIGSESASIKAMEKKLFNDQIKVMTKNYQNLTVPNSNRFRSQ